MRPRHYINRETKWILRHLKSLRRAVNSVEQESKEYVTRSELVRAVVAVIAIVTIVIGILAMVLNV